MNGVLIVVLITPLTAVVLPTVTPLTLIETMVLPLIGKLLRFKILAENFVVLVLVLTGSDTIYTLDFSINNEPISEEYINENTKYADQIIQISNDIISYDLIKEIESKK